jgi:hypothetical protein
VGPLCAWALPQSREEEANVSKTQSILLLGVIVLSLGTTGCASIISGTHQAVRFSSEPMGAMANASGYVTTTPGTLDLKTYHRYTVDFKLDGYHPATAVVGRSFNPWFLGNILLGGVIGMVVDLATGAFWQLDTDNVHVVLIPLGATAGPSPGPTGHPGPTTTQASTPR